MDKAAIVVNMFAVVMVPIVVAIFGTIINSSIQSRQADIRMVELAVGVLQGSPDNKPDSTALRTWATQVIDRYSPVPLSAGAREALLNTPLPYPVV